nr:F-box only protein 50 [Ictidomys tridecemlineatus]
MERPTWLSRGAGSEGRGEWRRRLQPQATGKGLGSREPGAAPPRGPGGGGTRREEVPRGRTRVPDLRQPRGDSASPGISSAGRLLARPSLRIRAPPSLAPGAAAGAGPPPARGPQRSAAGPGSGLQPPAPRRGPAAQSRVPGLPGEADPGGPPDCLPSRAGRRPRSPEPCERAARGAPDRWCFKRQLVDLVMEGVWQELLDSAQIEICVADWWGARENCGCIYRLRVRLLDTYENEVVKFSASPNPVLQWTERSCRQVSHVFTNFGKGIRYVSFEQYGRDMRSWVGHYGALVTHSSVRIRIRPS